MEAARVSVQELRARGLLAGGDAICDGLMRLLKRWRESSILSIFHPGLIHRNATPAQSCVPRPLVASPSAGEGARRDGGVLADRLTEDYVAMEFDSSLGLRERVRFYRAMSLVRKATAVLLTGSVRTRLVRGAAPLA